MFSIPVFLYCFNFCRGRIELGDVTPHNIKQLKLLNQVVFPVSYNDKFYKDVLEAGELAKLGECQFFTYLIDNGNGKLYQFVFLHIYRM